MRAYTAKHREKLRAQRRASYARTMADPVKAEAYRVRRRQWERKAAGTVDAHGETRSGACEICQRAGKLHFDHDHTTGATRGWLCGNCNRAIGLLQDSPSVLAAAKSYLETKGTTRLYARVA